MSRRPVVGIAYIQTEDRAKLPSPSLSQSGQVRTTWPGPAPNTDNSDGLSVLLLRVLLQQREGNQGRGSPFWYVLGPVPGVGVMSKGPQGWVQCGCEDRLLPCTTKQGGSYSLPRLHDSTTREDLGGGARGLGPGVQARSRRALGASMQRKDAVPDSFVPNK
jgi:hypothetical protein